MEFKAFQHGLQQNDHITVKATGDHSNMFSPDRFFFHLLKHALPTIMQHGPTPAALWPGLFFVWVTSCFELCGACVFDCGVLFCLCQARAASGIKGLFHRNPKQASLDSHAAAQQGRKHPFGAHLLRRTASAPTKGQPKVKKGFPEITIDTKEYSSEGASEERESDDRDKASAAASHQPTPPQHHAGDSLASHPDKGPRDHPDTNGAFHPEEAKGKSPHFTNRRPMSEPLKRAARLHLNEPAEMKPGVFARVALKSSGKVGVSSNCITCVVSSKESPETERKVAEERGKRSNGHSSSKRHVQPESVAQVQKSAPQPELQQSPLKLTTSMEAKFQYVTRSKTRQTLGVQHVRPQHVASQRNARSCSVPRRRTPTSLIPALSVRPDCSTHLSWQQSTPPKYGTFYGSMLASSPRSILIGEYEAVSLSDSSSCDSLSSLELPPVLQSRSALDGRKRAVGTLQREMNALFSQKMEELHHRSPMFFAGKMASKVEITR